MVLAALGVGLTACSANHDYQVIALGEDVQSTLSPEQQLASDMGYSSAVEPIRAVDPNEQMVLVHQCLVEDGWPVELSGDGTLSVSLPLDQEQAYSDSSVRCRLLYPLAEEYARAWGPEEYGILYDHWVAVTIPCLRDKGYEAPDPPARETFINESLVNQPTYVVDMVAGRQILDDVDGGRWASEQDFWENICPLEPAKEVLYGP